MKKRFEEAGIPTAVIAPETLQSSALISQSLAAAIKGQMAFIDEIMDTELPTLPKWLDDLPAMREEYKRRL